MLLRFVITAVSVLILSGCGDQTSATRRSNCELYTKLGYLKGDQIEKCVWEKETFTLAATNYTNSTIDNIMPSLVRAKAALGSQFVRFDKSEFLPLPAELAFPIFIFDEKDKEKNWKFFLHMQDVLFSAPALSDQQLRWTISGNEGSTKSFASFPLDGIPPNSLMGLDNACWPFSDSQNFKGCEADVYVDISNKTSPLAELIVVAIDFHPPTKEQLTAKFLERELSDWLPTETR